MKLRFLAISFFVAILALTASGHELEKPIHEMLNVAEPVLLPDNPFYLIKNFGRNIRLFFAFNHEKKVELELNFTDEKLAEVAKTAESEPKTSLEKALKNYLNAQMRLKNRLESLKNKKADKLLEKLAERIKIHRKIFEALEDEIGEEASEKANQEIKKTEEKVRELNKKKPEKTPDEKQKESQNKQKTIIIWEDGRFMPPAVKIKKGDTMTWINKSKSPSWPASGIHPTHQLYAGFDAKHGITPNESFSFTFNKTGTWSYHDHLNARNTGIIEVME